MKSNFLNIIANRIKLFAVMSVILTAGFSTSVAQAAKCGKVSVAEMNWASAQIVAAISGFILEQGFDCKVSMVQTSTVPGITSLINKGEPNFAPEAWSNSVKNILDKGLAKSQVVELGDMFSNGGKEMWLLPKYFADKHNIRTIEDVKKNYKLFTDPENPSKGRFFNCPDGWACQIINTNLFKAYGMDENFTNFNTGSGEGLKSSLAKAYARKEAWFGYYWGPTAVLGKYDMQVVGMNAPTVDGHKCNINKDCSNPHAGSYPRSQVAKLATPELLSRDSLMTVFLARYEIPNAILNKVLAWKEDSQADANSAAAYFMAKYPNIWKRWLSGSALAKVEKSL